MHSKISYNDSDIYLGPLEEVQFNHRLASQYKQARKVIITDETVHDLWMEALITSYEELAEAEIIQIPPGEENKTLDICAQIWGALSEYEIGRNDLIINFGGGVVTDLGGFIASTYKRGLDFINIPTTLLSQVDASVGGKTGIDLGPYKNQIGVFLDPKYVFIDTVFLQTLADDEILSGFAEMLKHGLIADRQYWYDLIAVEKLSEISIQRIEESVNLKRVIVTEDFKEAGERKKLNFGHTIGHALEGYLLQNGNPHPHGYCVAYGMIAEAHLSYQKDNLADGEFELIKSYLTDNYPKLPITVDAIPELMQLMQNDKKNDGGEIRFTFLNGIGDSVVDQTAEEIEVISALTTILNS